MSSFIIDVKISDSIKERIYNVGSEGTMLAIHNSLAKHCDPYVPFLHGPLSQTHVVTPKGVTYIQPYARYQYFGVNFNHTKETHPLATAKWDKAMLRDHREEFEQEIADIIQWRLKNYNG